MTQTIKQEPITIQWLIARGWTVPEAAEYIGRTESHLHRVLKGERSGDIIFPILRRLPQKKLTALRRKR